MLFYASVLSSPGLNQRVVGKLSGECQVDVLVLTSLFLLELLSTAAYSPVWGVQGARCVDGILKPRLLSPRGQH